jgi:hexosaminidase
VPPAIPRPRPAPDSGTVDITEPAADVAASPAGVGVSGSTSTGDLARTATASGVVGTTATGTVAAPAPVALDDVVPAPVSGRPAAGVTFTLTADATIQATANAEAMAVGDYLAELLRPATGYPLPVTAAGPARPAGAIALLMADADDDSIGSAGGAEGYQLDVTADGIVIRARTAAGLFYGVQTLRQLLPATVESGTVQPGPWIMPGGQIVDHPRFAYRGAMLDVSRHFFEVADVLRYVDQLARYKINHLHLHLTDDQGWRIAIDSWPELASVGGATEVDGGAGGCYSQEQYREIVAYAAARHITIVPEIDMPGHTNAALTAYGALSPDAVAPPPYTGTDVGFSALSVASDLTYDFVDDVLGEVAALTPGPYLHIGGDEAFTLAPPDYATFMHRVQPIVSAKGKRVLGWHQLAATDGPGDRVIQYWGTATADATVAAAVQQGAQVILSPGNRTYLDMKYTDATPLGKDWAGLVEVRAAYDWDPGSYLEDVPAAAVLGVEAPLWTETVGAMSEVEFMTFPRLPAVAELGWSPASTHDWEAFRRRLAGQGPRWTLAGITFYRSPQVPWAQLPAGTAAPAEVSVPAEAPAPADVPVPADVPAGSPTRVIGPVETGRQPAATGSSGDDDVPFALS